MENKDIVISVVDDEIIEIDYTHIITEDNKSVDNLFSEKQQRLLTEPLYTSWKPQNGKIFFAIANVGLFYSTEKPALVPDMMLSLGVSAPPEMWEKQHRSYFIWKYGKPPEIVIEIVSNLKGNELGDKKEMYAKIGIPYYVIFDPAEHYGKPNIRVFENKAFEYYPKKNLIFNDLGLHLIVWEGEYEGVFATWLRWADHEGKLILTGKEQEMRAEKLAQKLRELGINPEE
jgi:Uma2 family endonuclease